MTSKLKTEKSFKNPESREARSLMFTVLESKSPCTDKKCLVLPHSFLPEVDRVQQILSKS